MYMVETYLAPSAIEGTGVFAAEAIAAGTRLWVHVDDFDMLLTPQQVNALPQAAQTYIKNYAYLNEGYICFNGDNGRFTNHSDQPNTGMDDVHMVALRPIKKGEELTCNYYDFDEWAAEKLRGAKPTLSVA